MTMLFVGEQLAHKYFSTFILAVHVRTPQVQTIIFHRKLT